MGLETALVVGGLSIARGIGQYNQAKSNARSLRCNKINKKQKSKEFFLAFYLSILISNLCR